MVNLRITAPTALLFLLDALRSTEKTYKVELYLEGRALGGVLWELDDLAGQGRMLFAENDLPSLLQKFVVLLQQAGAEGGKPEAAEGISEAPTTPELHPADATGVS